MKKARYVTWCLWSDALVTKSHRTITPSGVKRAYTKFIAGYTKERELSVCL